MLINIQVTQQYKVIEINEQLLQQNNRSDMHINSPQFSNSSKGNLSNIISPSRNKRIVSSQHCFSALPSHRNNNNNNSCKKLDSPSVINQIVHKDKDKDKMRKKSTHGTHGTNITNNVYNGHIKTKSKDMVMEMNGLKELKQQYMVLKVKYKELVSDKVKWVEKQNKIQEQNMNSKKVIQRLERENDNFKGKIGFLEMEIERIKKESVKLVQVWEFRIRNVQQNLSQKQKIISDLRQCLKDHKISQPHSSSKRSYSPYIINQQNNQTIYNKSLSILSQSLGVADYLSSLSETSQYLNSSLSQIRQKSQLIQTVYNKHHLVSIDVENTLQDITNKTTQQPKSKKNEGNFKKLKKQLGKKIQTNCEDKQRQLMAQILPKTPMDRKVVNNKSTKVPKIKIRKQQEYVESKSSKKKMSAR